MNEVMISVDETISRLSIFYPFSLFHSVACLFVFPSCFPSTLFSSPSSLLFCCCCCCFVVACSLSFFSCLFSYPRKQRRARASVFHCRCLFLCVARNEWPIFYSRLANQRQGFLYVYIFFVPTSSRFLIYFIIYEVRYPNTDFVVVAVLVFSSLSIFPRPFTCDITYHRELYCRHLLWDYVQYVIPSYLYFFPSSR